ncbi:MAG: ABC transporter substrate-binding protein [Bacteroidales bacterium]|nr:ABC transporter substrate-binding protein [Bacteroidales bacterium]
MKCFLKHTFLVLLIASMLLSCRNGSSKKNPDTIHVVTLRGPAGISMVHMMDSLKKLDDKKLSFQIKNEPLQVRPLLFQEKTEFAVVPTNMASILYNKGVNYQLAAIPVWGTLYLFGDQKDVSRWQDLKGRKIYLMAKGMTPDVMFRYLLQANGLDPQEDVTLDYSFPTHIELANAVASGKAPLAVISEPLVSMVIKKNRQVQPILSLNEAWKKQTDSEIPQTALLVHQQFAKSNPSLVNAFLEAYKHSISWVNKHPDQGAQRITHYKILNDPQVAAQSIPRCNIRLERAENIQDQILNYLNTFYRMNPDIVGGQMPDEKFFFRK